MSIWINAGSGSNTIIMRQVVSMTRPQLEKVTLFYLSFESTKGVKGQEPH